MVNKIRITIDKLFEEAPATHRTLDLKEELIGNLTAKYMDLVASGKTEEEAYNIAITSIGDLNELLRSLEPANPLNYKEQEAQRKKTALVVSGSIGLYIIAIISGIICEEIPWLRRTDIPALIFLGIAGFATCLLVYHFVSKPKYEKSDTTIVEEFKEWKQGNDQKRQIYRSFSSIMWSCIVLLYLVISFRFGIWYCSWIIFIMGVVAEQIIKLIFEIKGMR